MFPHASLHVILSHDADCFNHHQSAWRYFYNLTTKEGCVTGGGPSQVWSPPLGRCMKVLCNFPESPFVGRECHSSLASLALWFQIFNIYFCSDSFITIKKWLKVYFQLVMYDLIISQKSWIFSHNYLVWNLLGY
jgi:hypothetical protein